MKIRMNEWLVFSVVAIGPLMAGIGFLAIGIAMEPIATYYQAPMHVLQWFISAYAVGCSALFIIAGEFVDRYSGKLVYLSGLLLFVLSCMLTAVSESVWIAIVGRLIQGVSGGLLNTSAIAIIVQEHQKKERSIWLSRIVGAAGLGMVLGPSLGGFLIQKFNWQSLFLVNVPICFLSLFLGYFILPNEKKNGRQHDIDFVGVLLLMITTVSLTVILTQASRLGWFSYQIMICFFTFLSSLALLAGYEMKIPNPVICFAVLKYKNLISGSSVAFLSYFVVISWLFLWGVYFQRALGFEPLKAGLYFLPFGISMLGTCLLIPSLLKQLSNQQLLQIGCACGMLGFVGLGLQAIVFNWVYLFVSFSLIGACFALTNSASMPVALHFVPEHKLGLASGKTMMFRWLGGVMGPALSALLLSSFVSQESLPAASTAVIASYHYGMSGCMWTMAFVCVIALLIASYLVSDSE